jgi:hypothetical protein
VLALGLLTLAAAAEEKTGAPTGLRIQGLPADVTLEGPVSKHQWEGAEAVLQVGTATVRVNPWPRALGRRSVVGYTLKGQLTTEPSGPDLRLELTPPRQRAPTHLLGARTRPGLPLLPDWHLALEKPGGPPRLVGKAKGASALPLSVEKATRVRQGSETWCVQLLAVHARAASEPGLSDESPAPRFDWVATRASGASCPAPSR